MDPELRRLALAPLLLGFTGPTPPRWLLDALTDGLGGVVLFAGNLVDDPAVLVDRLRDAAGRDIVVALDEEGGDVTRLHAGTGSPSPGAAALGYRDDPAVTRAEYHRIGAELARIGVTVDLAPVADVNTDPRNPVIGVRSFGSDPERVAAHVAAAVRGIQDTGVAACVKHFPGHGATRADSHHEVAVLDRSRDELTTVELVPFRAAVDAGARAVMTGHLLVPTLDADRIATISRPITVGLLRGELGFTGTVVTDALEMRAVSATVGMLDGFLAALAAGADAVEAGALDHPDLLESVPAAVAGALAGGQLDDERLAEAGVRTSRLAARGTGTAAPAGHDPFAVEVLGTLPDLATPLVIECRPPGGMAAGELPWSLVEPLARRMPGVEAGDAPVTDRDLVVVLRDPQQHPSQRDVLARARRVAASRLVVVDVGWPAGSGHHDGVEVPTIRTRGVAPGLLDRAAAVLAEGQERGR